MCLGEMAQLYAFLSFDEYKDLRGAKEELERQNFALIKRLGELENIECALADAGYKRFDDGSIGLRGGYIAGVDEIPADRTPGTTTTVGTRKRTTFESSDDEGVGELHSDESSSDDDFKLEF
jgi:hypothetical protein